MFLDCLRDIVNIENIRVFCVCFVLLLDLDTKQIYGSPGQRKTGHTPFLQIPMVLIDCRGHYH